MAKGQQKQPGAAKDVKVTDRQQVQKKVRPQVIHGDLYQRANFTFQASAFLQQLQSQSALDSQTPPPDRLRNDTPIGSARQNAPDFTRRSRNIMSANGKMVIHNQMKLDPSMKRNICETCSTVLIPGLTSRVRNRPSRVHSNVTHTICLSCDTRRTIPCPPTSLGEEGLDGKKRAARRRKQAKRAKVPFHNRESTSATGPESQSVQKGHTLWRGDKTVDGWGETPTPTSTLTDTNEK